MFIHVPEYESMIRFPHIILLARIYNMFANNLIERLLDLACRNTQTLCVQTNRFCTSGSTNKYRNSYTHRSNKKVYTQIKFDSRVNSASA